MLDEEAIRDAIVTAQEPSRTTPIKYEYPQLDCAARVGLADEFVSMVEPETEADPAALLIQFLVAFGNAKGRSAYFEIEAVRHYGNLFAVGVGPTAAGRKGTAWAHVLRAFGACNTWIQCNKSGMSSGEGVIHAVRDSVTEMRPKRQGGRIIEYEEVVIDPGVKDKRLLIFAPEFSRALKVATRETNILSDVIRQAWDSGSLNILNKNSPEQAIGAHISIIGHISRDELLKYLAESDCSNGFANRFLWYCARRSKELPEGGNIDESRVADFQTRITSAITRAQELGRVTFSAEARKIWYAVYRELSASKPGLLSAIINRAEAQTLRLAVVYAALRGASEINSDDLQAALAVWSYCEASARFVFGDKLGHPIADRILSELRTKGELIRTEIVDLFKRHVGQSEIETALALLKSEALAYPEVIATGGRPREVWRPCEVR